jgi:hypothetical protein
MTVASNFAMRARLASRARTRGPTEAQIQSAVIAHWRQFGVPGSLVAAIPNGNAHGQAGLTKGLPDLLVVSPKLGGATGFMELKTEQGRLSIFQTEIGSLMKGNGIPWTVTYGRDEPIDVLELWGAVKPRATP